MKLCESCRYRNNTEYEKPCIVYRDDCKFYEKERGDMADDLISRDAVIYYIKGHIHEIITESGEDKNAHTNRVLRALINGVETMPPVNPQEPCGEIVSLEAFKQVMWERDIAIGQLKELGYGFGQKIEPCNDAISRQAVLDGIDTYIYKAQSTGTQDDFYSFAELVVKQLPSVNPQEPKTGHWIEHPEKETSTPEYLMFYECSECGDKQCFCKSDIHKKRFCSNCGCRMVEPQESEVRDD